MSEKIKKETKKMKKINFKKCLSSLLAVCMSAALIAVPASAEDEIFVSQPVYSVADEIVPIPQAGELTTSVDIMGTGQAKLICALYDKETGKLLDIEASEMATANEDEATPLSVTMMVPSVKANIFKCFVWDTKTMKPFDVPADDKLYLIAEKIGNRVNLAWYALDDVLEGEFDIYRDGEVVATVTDKGGYVHEVIDDGEYHDYQIITSDYERESDIITIEPEVTQMTAEAVLANASYSYGNADASKALTITRNATGNDNGFITNSGWGFGQLKVPVDTDGAFIADAVIYVKVTANQAFGYTYKKYDPIAGAYTEIKKNNAFTPAEAGKTQIFKIDAPFLSLDNTAEVLADDAAGASLALCGCGVTLQVNGVWIFDGKDVTPEMNQAILGIKEEAMTREEALALADISYGNADETKTMWRSKNGWGADNGGFTINSWNFAHLTSNYDRDIIFSNAVVYFEVNAAAAFGYSYKMYDPTTKTNIEKKINYACTPSKFGENVICRAELPNLMPGRRTGTINNDSTGAFLGVSGCGKNMNVYGIWVFDAEKVTDSMDLAIMGTVAEKYPNGVSVSFADGAQVQSGLSYSAQGGDGSVTITGDYMEIGKHVSGSSSWPKKPRFVIDDAYICGTADKYVQLEIEYATNLGTVIENPANEKLFIDYVTTEGNTKRKYADLENDGEKHTTTVVLEDANLANNLDSKYDFVISRMAGDMDNEYLHVYGVKVTNLSHKPIEGYK